MTAAAHRLPAGHGNLAIDQLLAAGVCPSLSVDTCTNVSGDLFAIMRATLASAWAVSNARVQETGVMPTEVEISARDVLEFGTLRRAVANGLGDDRFDRGRQSEPIWQ